MTDGNSAHIWRGPAGGWHVLPGSAWLPPSGCGCSANPWTSPSGEPWDEANTQSPPAIQRLTL